MLCHLVIGHPAVPEKDIVEASDTNVAFAALLALDPERSQSLKRRRPPADSCADVKTLQPRAGVSAHSVSGTIDGARSSSRYTSANDRTHEQRLLDGVQQRQHAATTVIAHDYALTGRLTWV